MAGLFGSFTNDTHIENAMEILNIITEEKYCIKNSVIDRFCVFCSLDIDSNKSDKITQKMEGDIGIVSCGGIYNEDISDLEKTILDLYKNDALHLLKDFNGSFAAAIYDAVKEKMILVNDRNGSIKMFYCADNNRFFFAPKIKPLLKLGANTALSKDAIIDFFIFGYPLGDKTLFEHVHQLPPASILEFSKNGMKILNYWNYAYYGEYDSRSKDELIDELGILWQNAVKRRIKKDKTNVILSSGGLDSRAVLAAAVRCTSKDDITTFTFGEKGSFDFDIGRMVSNVAGIKNVAMPVEKENFETQYEISIDDVEGMIDATPYFTVEGYKNIGEYGNTFLTGYMGGELMGPLIFSKIVNKKIKLEENLKVAKKLLFEHHRLNDLEVIQKLLNPTCFETGNLLNSFEDSIKDIDKISDKHFPNYCAAWLYRHENDKYTAFCNFRYRNHFRYIAPFLDNDLVDFMLKIPPEFRMNKKLYKSMLLKKYSDLFQLPIKNSFGLKLDVNTIRLFLRRALLASKTRVNKVSSLLIKRNIFFDKLENYIDYNDFLRTNKEYMDYVEKMINRVKVREYFNKDYIEQLWKLHMQGRKNYAKLFGLLVTFELFLEKFVDIPQGTDNAIILRNVSHSVL